MGAINLWRLARRASIRPLVVACVVLISTLTVLHHTLPDHAGTADGMHGGDMAMVMVCLGVLQAAALVRRSGGIVRVKRALTRLRWYPRVAVAREHWLLPIRAPARDGPALHLRFQVIRR